MPHTAPPDGTRERRQFLVHIDAAVIRRTKILVIDRNVTASSLVQQALVEFLARQATRQATDNNPETTPC